MDDESVFGKDMMKYMMYFIMALSVGGAILGAISPGARGAIGGALQGRVTELYTTFCTMAFLYMIMGAEKDAKDIISMSIMLIAASQILASTYGAGGGIVYGGSIIGAMFAGKLLKKYVSGQGAEDAFKDWYGGKGPGESIVKQLGSAPSNDATQKIYLRVGQGEISLSQPLLDLYDQLAAFKQIPNGDPTQAAQAVTATRLATAYRKLKAQVNGIEGDKLVKGLMDLKPYTDALVSAKDALEAADKVTAAATAAHVAGMTPTQYGKMVAI